MNDIILSCLSTNEYRFFCYVQVLLKIQSELHRFGAIDMTASIFVVMLLLYVANLFLLLNFVYCSGCSKFLAQPATWAPLGRTSLERR